MSFMMMIVLAFPALMVLVSSAIRVHYYTKSLPEAVTKSITMVGEEISKISFPLLREAYAELNQIEIDYGLEPTLLGHLKPEPKLAAKECIDDSRIVMLDANQQLAKLEPFINNLTSRRLADQMRAGDIPVCIVEPTKSDPNSGWSVWTENPCPSNKVKIFG